MITPLSNVFLAIAFWHHIPQRSSTLQAKLIVQALGKNTQKPSRMQSNSQRSGVSIQARASVKNIKGVCYRYLQILITNCIL